MTSLTEIENFALLPDSDTGRKLVEDLRDTYGFKPLWAVLIRKVEQEIRDNERAIREDRPEPLYDGVRTREGAIIMELKVAGRGLLDVIGEVGMAAGPNRPDLDEIVGRGLRTAKHISAFLEELETRSGK